MAKYRAALPQIENGIFLHYVGMETDLIYNRGVDLPGFASYPLLETEDGRNILRGQSDFSFHQRMEAEKNPCQGGPPECHLQRADPFMKNQLGKRPYKAPHEPGADDIKKSLQLHGSSNEKRFFLMWALNLCDFPAI